MKFLAQWFFRITLLPIIRTIYRIRSINADCVPKTGGVLLIPNHVSYIDSFIIYAASPRPVRFIIVDHFMGVKSFAWFLKLFGAVPIRPSRAKEAIQITSEAIKNGDVLAIFPEGTLSRTGVVNELKRGFELIARKADAPVVPVYMDGLWNSIFSFERNAYFKKWPRSFQTPVTVAFGEPTAPKEAKHKWAQQQFLELSNEAFSHRDRSGDTLDIALIRALKEKPRRDMFIEEGKSTRKIRRSQVLGVSVALSRRWKQSPLSAKSRIGVLLPSGPTPALMNLGLILSGKTPVNLPFEAVGNPKELEKVARAIEALKIDTIITSKAFVPQLAGLTDEAESVTIVDMGAQLSRAGSVMVLFERMRCWIEPTWMAKWRLELKELSNHKEIAGMVPFGSYEPIFLSGSEIQANASQVTSANFVQVEERIFSDLPLSTVAGMYLSLWGPLLSMGKVISRSFAYQQTPERIEDVVVDFDPTLIVDDGRPRKQLETSKTAWEFGAEETVRNILTFEPDLKEADVKSFSKITNLPVRRGWACDAVGKILTMSMNSPHVPLAGHAEQPGHAPGSVGKFLPGITARINDKAESLMETGELAVRTDPIDSSNEPYVFVAEKARLDIENFVYLGEEADEKAKDKD